MDDSIKIELTPDGIISVEGSKAISAAVSHRRTPNGLEVRYLLTPTGDDALHGGSLEAVFTMTKPEFVPNSDKGGVEQASIGADYASGFVDVMQNLIGEGHLAWTFSQALTAAMNDMSGVPAEIVEAVQAIALLLLHLNDGDREKAKAEFDSPRLTALAQESGLDTEHLSAARDLIYAAIDLADVNGA